jgi:hypothetical protein
MQYSIIFRFDSKDPFNEDLIITISNVIAENQSTACTIAINEFVKSHFPPSYYEAYKKIEQLYIDDEGINKSESYWNSDYKPSCDEESGWCDFTTEVSLQNKDTLFLQNKDTLFLQNKDTLFLQNKDTLFLQSKDTLSFPNEINEILESLPQLNNIEKKNSQQSQFISLLVRRNISIQIIIKRLLKRVDLEVVSGIYINIR